MITNFFICPNAFTSNDFPVPPFGESEITSSFKITAGE